MRKNLSQTPNSLRNSRRQSELPKYKKNISASKKSLTMTSKNLNIDRNVKIDPNIDLHENLDDKRQDEEILYLNNRNNIKIISTKIEKTNEINNTHKIIQQAENLYNTSDERRNFFNDEDLDLKIKHLEKNLLCNKKDFLPEFNMMKNKEENPYDPEYDVMCIMNKDLNHKFDNLLDLEESMKKLNQILEFSNKSSLKFKLEQEVSPYPNNEYERNNLSINYSDNDEKEPLPYKMESNLPNKLIVHNDKVISKQQNNGKTIDLSKSKKVFHIEEKILKCNYEDNNGSDSFENLDYLKDLLLKTKSDLENFNKKFDK
jgi:hypothetical protein